MKPEGSLPRLQVPAICPYTEHNNNNNNYFYYYSCCFNLVWNNHMRHKRFDIAS